MKTQTIVTNFTGGERAPDLDGRVDLQRYNASAKELRNCVVLKKGGITAAPSRDHLAEIKNSATQSRLIEFIYSRATAYVLEFGNLYMRVMRNGAQIESSPGVPYEIVTPFTTAQIDALDFAYGGGDTIIFTHPEVPVQRLLRFGDASWRMEAAPFNPAALGETGHRDAAVNLSIDNPAVGTGRTITASGALFLAADVGRIVSWGTGTARITAVGGPTSATADVLTAFPAAAQAGPGWLLEGTPLTTITPSAKDPEGATITLTLGAAGWRAVDVGKFVEVNGGLVEITGFTSSLIVNAVIRSVLADVVAAPADAWVLRGSLWNAVDGYPRSCCFYQQRLWLGSTSKYPKSLWGSRTALFFDFTPGTLDDSAVYKTIDSDDSDALAWLCSVWALLALTGSSESDARGGIEKPITQLNMQINERSNYGTGSARPQKVGKDLLVSEASGLAVRALANEGEGFSSRDISVWSEHLFTSGVRAITFQQRPQQVAWIVTGDGAMVPLTYSSEQEVVAFCSSDSPGVIESAVTVPEGAKDVTYVIARYEVDGATKRYIERVNWSVYPGMNSRVEQTVGVAQATWSGFEHQEGETLALLADDVYVGTATVTGGQVTLPRPALKLAAGLPYTARAVLQAPEQGSSTGTSQGQSMSTNEVILRVLNTIGGKMNGQFINPRQFGVGILDTAPVPSSGLRNATDFGWERGESDIVLEQDLPYPWTVLAVIRHMTVNPS
jgi:hypothetical protein